MKCPRESLQHQSLPSVVGAAAWGEFAVAGVANSRCVCMPTGCFAELYFSPVVGLSLMVDLNLAYLLKGERLNTSTTQLVFVLVGGVFLWGSLVFFPHDSRSLFGPAFQLHVEEGFLLQGLLFIADFKNIFIHYFMGGFFQS